MKKIMKRLLTGVLTLATVFTALPVTQVHAADSVYTTTDGKAGTIVKIDNGGSEVSSFEESIMNADGQISYCIDINTNFQSVYKNRSNATERMSDDQISDVALNLEYVKQYAEKHSLSSKQDYLLEQCVVWRRLSVHLGWGYNNVRAAYDEVSEKIQSEVYEKERTYDLKCKEQGRMIQVSIPATVPLKEFDYNAEVEIINPVADTVATATFQGADVDWYIKADDIVLKNKNGQPAGNPQHHNQQSQNKK